MLAEQDLEKVGYLVVVKILEARDLKGDNAGGISPYVKVSCGNLESQQTKTVFKAAQPVWNQSFTFPDLKLNKFELESLELNLEVYDQLSWWTNQMIGGYSIGLSTMYRSPNSDIYKKWLRLSLPDSPTRDIGFLQVSCFIVGPGQEPPVHESDEPEGDALMA